MGSVVNSCRCAMRWSLALAAFAFVFTAPWGVASESTAQMWLAPSDRILFVGPVAFEQRSATAMVETYVALRFAEYQVGFKHASVFNADNAVEAYSPTMVVLLSGVEPLACDASKPGAQDAESAYVALLKRWSASKPELRVLVALPPACPASVAERAQLVSAAAMFKYSVVLDTEPGTAGLSSTPENHGRLARQVIDAWSLPAELVQVEINAHSNRSTTTANTVVRELKADEWVSWTQDDHTPSLPFELVTAGFAHLNQRQMKVVGLLHPQYRLTIDGRDFGIYPRAAFDTGLDIGQAPTPSANRSSNVYRKVLQRLQHWCEQQQSRPPNQLTPDEADLLAEIMQAAKPASHDFELQPVN